MTIILTRDSPKKIYNSRELRELSSNNPVINIAFNKITYYLNKGIFISGSVGSFKDWYETLTIDEQKEYLILKIEGKI